ncbi:MAG: hypothetical protein KC912_23605 [Proteobacteria bacterium]|nr:hypothetical protein [Pseudomonadota bacterium]
MRALLATALLFPTLAAAQVDPRCADIEQPADYDERTQQDFMANYVALATTWSPGHAPIPHEPGHGAIGLSLGVIPPLSCKKRFVLNWNKTEDTNKAPAVPRVFARFAFPEVGPLTPYASIGYLPPVPLLGTRNVFLSGEFGLGARIGEKFQLGGRFHATSQKTIGEIATPFTDEEPAVVDLYLASSFGVDLMVGYEFGPVTPFASVGFTDVSTFFYIGDDGVVTSNLHPYAGLATSLGAEGRIGKFFLWSAEFYAAPGGHSKPDPEAESLAGFGRYGSLATGRVQLAVEL